MKQQGLDPSMLNDIMRRIVEVAQPERIILFGYAAGGMGPCSDVDLLIVKEVPNLRKLMARVYRRLYGVRAAVDIVMATPPPPPPPPPPGDVERYKDSHALVIKSALREGRVVYEAT